MTTSTRITLAAATATLLGAVPLAGGFAQQRWLWYTALALATVACIGVLTRLARLPAPVTLILQVAGLLVFHALIFATHDALLYVIPTGHTLRDLSHSLSAGIHDSMYLAPPVPSHTDILVLASLAIGALGIVVDVIAASLRRPAIAGLALLALFAVATSVNQDVLWLEFLCAGGGYLLLLSVDGKERLVRWGRLVVSDDRPGQTEEHAPVRMPRHGAGGRMGALALAAALVIPVFVPGFSRNVLTSLGHGNSNGPGNGSLGTSINPFTSLQGQLTQEKPINLFRVQTGSGGRYTRATVLDEYTPGGWRIGRQHGRSVDAGGTMLRLPDQLGQLRSSGQTREVTETITVERYAADYLPVVFAPTRVDGLSSGWQYDQDRSEVWDQHSGTRPGLKYQVQASEPRLSTAELTASPQLAASSPVMKEWGQAPHGVKKKVVALTKQVASGANGPYRKALALQSYFKDGKNGFKYSLGTVSGASEDELVAFLTHKRGYCEQYASAMAVMLRLIGVPSRVVLGYTAGTQKDDTTYEVTNHDAHAWVEAYLDGLGWLTFDPTPLSDNRALPAPYLPHPSSGGPTASASAPSVAAPSSSGPSATSSLAAGAGGGHGGSGGLTSPATVGILLGALLVLGLGAAPGLARRTARRRRIAIAGGPDPAAAASAAWDEVLTTATDYRIPMSSAESPRATASRLGGTPGLSPQATAALAVVALAEERARYARTAGVDADLPTALRVACEGLGAGRDRKTRLRVALFPRSSRETLARQLDRANQRAGASVGALARITRFRDAPQR